MAASGCALLKIGRAERLIKAECCKALDYRLFDRQPWYVEILDDAADSIRDRNRMEVERDL